MAIARMQCSLPPSPKVPPRGPCLHLAADGERVQPDPLYCPAQTPSSCGCQTIQDWSPLLSQSCGNWCELQRCSLCGHEGLEHWDCCQLGQSGCEAPLQGGSSAWAQPLLCRHVWQRGTELGLTCKFLLLQFALCHVKRWRAPGPPTGSNNTTAGNTALRQAGKKVRLRLPPQQCPLLAQGGTFLPTCGSCGTSSHDIRAAACPSKGTRPRIVLGGTDTCSL